MNRAIATAANAKISRFVARTIDISDGNTPGRMAPPHIAMPSAIGYSGLQ
jgi:hypothetical protein